MPPVNVLIKPASSACNMNCAYCFYRDEAANRARPFAGMLSPERMEDVVRAAMDFAEGSCTFVFQGGEPTLAGLDFYREALRLEAKHQKPGVLVHNAIQTNGCGLDDRWAEFFAENRFLVGLSLDGPADIHNLNRVDQAGRDTFNAVMRTARLFDRRKVDYNILCVVTGRNARSVTRIYNFFKKQGFRWLQFIPCLEPLGQERGREKYALSARDYGEFLIRLFDLWYADLRRGEYVSVRHLDNWLSILLGERPESCGMTGRCSVQFVVEGDGGVYPCDFYVLDQWRLGTVGQDSFARMLDSETARRFVSESLQVPEACRACEYYPLCRNGCRRDRLTSGELAGRNAYCEAYRRFFEARYPALRQAAGLILQMRRGG